MKTKLFLFAQRYILFSITIISLWGCERAALPPDEIGSTEFNLLARVGSDTLQLQAGKNGYVFVPDHYTDSNGYMVLTGEIRPKTGNGDRVKLEIWDVQPNRPASIVRADLNQSVLPLGNISSILDSNTTSQGRDSLVAEVFTFTATNSTGQFRWNNSCNISTSPSGSTYQITLTQGISLSQCLITLSQLGTNASLSNSFDFTFGDQCRFQWDYQSLAIGEGLFTSLNGWDIDSIAIVSNIQGSLRLDTTGFRVSANTFLFRDSTNGTILSAELFGVKSNCPPQVYKQNFAPVSPVQPFVSYTYTVTPQYIRIPGTSVSTYQQRMALTFIKSNGLVYKSKIFTPLATDGRTANITRSELYQKGSDEAWRIFADLDLMLFEQTPSATPDSLRFRSGKFELGIGLPR